jgi:hypothetical protein
MDTEKRNRITKRLLNFSTVLSFVNIGLAGVILGIFLMTVKANNAELNNEDEILTIEEEAEVLKDPSNILHIESFTMYIVIGEDGEEKVIVKPSTESKALTDLNTNQNLYNYFYNENTNSNTNNNNVENNVSNENNVNQGGKPDDNGNGKPNDNGNGNGGKPDDNGNGKPNDNGNGNGGKPDDNGNGKPNENGNGKPENVEICLP